MANRFQTPRPQFFINPVTGLPLNGGKLYFYSSGTVTPLSTYTNSTLTIANTNPVVLLSTGYAATDIFLQNAAYTVVLTDSAGVTLWSADNVYTSDFSTVAMFTSYNGNPNGFVAGTAGSSLLAASVIWDYQNLVLYVCTATGVAASAVWLAVTSNTTPSSTPALQGYLTPVSATPIITADSISATSMFYTPYQGTSVSIYNGTALINSVFSELTLTLAAASHLASTLYDVFVFNNGGILTLVTGPAWSNSAAGTGARGVGAGTTQISRGTGIGIWTNTNSMSGVNGATTYAGIAAGQATYLGTILIDSAAGQVTCHRSYGQSRKFGIWNAYNRANIILKAGDGTASWAYGTNTIRAANNSALNSITILNGLPEEQIEIMHTQRVQLLNFNPGTGITASAQSAIGVGVNSTTVMTGTRGTGTMSLQCNTAGQPVGNFEVYLTARATVQPFLGIDTLTALELTPTNSNTLVAPTYFGTETNMLFSTRQKG